MKQIRGGISEGKKKKIMFLDGLFWKLSHIANTEGARQANPGGETAEPID